MKIVDKLGGLSERQLNQGLQRADQNLVKAFKLYTKPWDGLVDKLFRVTATPDST